MLRPRILAVPLILAVAVSLTGCGSVLDRVRETVRNATSGDGGIPAGGSDAPTPNTDVADLAAGDCFFEPEDEAPTAVATVGCDVEHENEVTGLVKVPGREYPGDLRVDKLAQIACRDALVAYVGRDFATSSLDYWYYTPDAESWNAGMRSVVCYGFAWNGDPLTASIRGSRI